jgi:hypothetical protein
MELSKRRDRPYQAGAGRRIGSRSKTRSIARWSEIVLSSMLAAAGTKGVGLGRKAGDADRCDERQRQGQSEDANERHGEVSFKSTVLDLTRNGEPGCDRSHSRFAACHMGLVSKHRDRLYQSGRSKFWVKVKNRKHPAMERVMD